MSEDQQLADQFRASRSNFVSICGGWGRPGRFEDNDKLQCAARIGSMQRLGSPSQTYKVSGPWDMPPSEELAERVSLTGYTGTPAEIVAYNFEDPASVVAGLRDAPNLQDLCWALATPVFQHIGVAHKGNVWWIVLGSPNQTSPAHSGPPPDQH